MKTKLEEKIATYQKQKEQITTDLNNAQAYMNQKQAELNAAIGAIAAVEDLLKDITIAEA